MNIQLIEMQKDVIRSLRKVDLSLGLGFAESVLVQPTEKD